MIELSEHEHLFYYDETCEDYVCIDCGFHLEKEVYSCQACERPIEQPIVSLALLEGIT